MAKSATALANKDLIVWGRRTRGYDVETAAKKIGVKPEKLEAWESGDARPTVSQLRKLEEAYKRPLAVFYLPRVPADFTPLRDYRRLPGEVAGVQTPELMYAVRLAQMRREAALELYESEGARPEAFNLRCRLDEDTEVVADRARAALGATAERRRQWTAGYPAFKNGWRDALEGRGVLVLQMRGVDTKESRGFSIAEMPLPVIAVNMSDSVRARTFSLLHECAHLMLRQGGLCDFDDRTARAPEELRGEVFCNRVAGATLIPRAELLADPAVAARGERRSEGWTVDEIGSLANRFGCSRIALVRRLLTLERTTDRFYHRKERQYEEEWKAFQESEKAKAKAKKERGEKTIVLPHTLAMATAGPHFVRLVLSAYYGDRITASALSDLLGLKLKHLQKVEAAVASRDIQ